MATPLKHLSAFVSPKLLSPRFLSTATPKFPDVSFKPVAKCLDFSPGKSLQNFQINVSNYDEGQTKIFSKDLLINTPNKNMLLKEGTVRNQTVNILGKGSFGTVIRGIYKGTTVAVKIVKNSGLINEKNALCLQHVNLINTLEIITKNQDFYMVLMDYYPDSNQLQNILDNCEYYSTKGWEQNFSLDISRGLDFCHRNHVLHLDLKPKNILVCNGICKICDFGSSLVISEESDGYLHKGTVIYTAPELLLGKFPTVKSDVYSLGIVLWQLLTKKNPYVGIDNNETIIYKVVKCQLRPEINDNFDPDYKKIICRCWEENPLYRPELNDIIAKLQLI